MLSLYWDPDNTPEARASIREEFVRALCRFPDWAVQRAFDRWTKTGTRRPSPAEIVLLAQRELQPFTDELNRRRRIIDEASQIDVERPRVTPDAAARILAEAGFTEGRFAAVKRMPLAGPDQIAEAARRPPHWSDAIPAGQEHDLDAIRAARAATGQEAAQ